MCFELYFDSRESAFEASKNPLIAKRDITVWKRVRKVDEKQFKSLYQNFMYDRGFEYENDKFDTVIRKIGFSYLEYIRYKITIDEGLHSYIKKPFVSKYNAMYFDEYALKCIIPKGALYYNNETEYVSNRLIIPYK